MVGSSLGDVPGAERHPCACCGYRTMFEPPGDGSHGICSVCGWEDDMLQWKEPTYRGGANRASLLEARRNFMALGASEEQRIGRVRKPLEVELPRHRW